MLTYFQTKLFFHLPHLVFDVLLDCIYTMKRILVILFFVTALSVGFHFFSAAQCAMCKANAESSLKEGNTQAKSLNMGIMYLLVMPYLLVGGIGYYWYVNKKKQNPSDQI